MVLLGHSELISKLSAEPMMAQVSEATWYLTAKRRNECRTSAGEFSSLQCTWNLYYYPSPVPCGPFGMAVTAVLLMGVVINWWAHLVIDICSHLGNPWWSLTNGCSLTHRGWGIYVSVNIIGSDNGLSPGQCKAIIWTNVGMLLIGSLQI